MPAKLFIIGRRFGKLLVLADAPRCHTMGGKAVTQSLCRCDCGVERLVRNCNLLKGYTKSCGCVKEQLGICKVKHGCRRKWDRPTLEYTSWRQMKSRCHNPRNARFADYGGRGILVCPEWRVSFEAFLAHVGPCPPDKTSIHRIDNDKGYEPGNVKWADDLEQQRHKRNNLIVTVRGMTGCVSELCEHFGMDQTIVGPRIYHGWDVEEAFFTPAKYRTRLDRAIKDKLI